MTRTYIIINDTARLSKGFHLGCTAVMDTITRKMRERGYTLGATINSEAEFDKFLSRGLIPNIAVINGEGTMHHNAPRAIALLNIAKALSGQSCKCVLVNSVWEGNSAEVGKLLEFFELISVREQYSWEEISIYRSDVRICPDLSIPYFSKRTCNEYAKTGKQKIIDTVLPSLAAKLYEYAHIHDHEFLIMGPGNVQSIMALFRQNPYYAAPWQVTLERIHESDRIISGRFHGSIASLVSGIPTIITESNTKKNMALSEAIDIDIYIAKAELPNDVNEWSDIFTDKFKLWDNPSTIEKMTNYFSQALRTIDKLFDDIASLQR